MSAKNNLALIVDDHPLVRTALHRLVGDHPLIGRVMETDTGEQAIEDVAIHGPDLVVMDLSLPGMSGTEASQLLLESNPQLTIIVLTGNTEDVAIQRLLSAGVLGYLTKGCTADEMEQAITDTLAGRQYLSNDVAQRVALDALGQPQTIEPPLRSPFDDLSGREYEIAMLLLDGQRNRQIGDKLFISEKTVSTHRTRAFDKLGIHSTVELARLAIRHGIWMDQTPT